jgi:hypothetical protein
MRDIFFGCCTQGFDLYSTGFFQIQLENPDSFREFGERVAEGDIGLAETQLEHWSELYDRMPSVLPDEPDGELIDKWLHKVRDTFYVKQIFYAF